MDKIMRFPKNVINDYPYPLATSAKRFNDATEDVERLLCLEILIETTIKYLASIATVEYLRDEEVVETLQKKLRKLRRPSLGCWNDLLRANVAHFASNPDKEFTVTELRDGYKAKLSPKENGVSAMLDGYRFVANYLKQEQRIEQKSISIQNFLDLMVSYRNETWGHGLVRLDAYTCADHAEVLKPAIEGLLERLAFLTAYPLLYVRKVEVQKGQYVHIVSRYMGETPEQITPYKGDYPRERRLYLCDKAAEPTLSLHPLFIVRRGSMYVLQYNEDNEQVTYASCATGEAYEPDNLQSFLITKLADDRHKKLEDIELPIPPEDPPEMLSSATLPTWAELLERLDDESRQAVVFGLGEATRIGHFWLGTEFLLMGLSRSETPLVRNFLSLVGVDGSDLRGMYRGMVGVKDRAWREKRDIRGLGAKLLPELQATPDRLADSFETDALPHAIITPRLKRAINDASALADGQQIGPGHLLRALLGYPESLAVNFLLRQAYEAGRTPQEIIAWLDEQIGLAPLDNESEELDERLVAEQSASEESLAPPLPVGGILAQNGRDLTALAHAGNLRPVVGTSAAEIVTQIGLILQQTQSNNPILLGDPGVGKTAIAEGFAWRLAVGAKHGQPVAPPLNSWRVVELSVASLMAGTSHRGDLEKKLQMLLKEVREADGQIIVFIDEIHAVLSGRSEGGLGTIADALKPALARGEFPCIGATTLTEYRRYIERDAALSRRFSPLSVEEPSPAEAMKIVGTVAQNYLAMSHGVVYPDEAVDAAVHLSRRYLHDEYLPGKAIKILDQAGPRVRLGGTLRGVPGNLEVAKPIVTEDIVRTIVAQRTGIPLSRLNEDESQRLLALEDRLRARVLGQDDALQQVSQVIKRARTGMAHPDKPSGVFLFAGPTGVGKTELALALADALFDEESAILRLDMSEFMEKHQVSRLVGAPPGYVGYEQEGQLTSFLRRRPYSLVLLDEMEKAHPEVQNLFLQLFDAGRISDSTGREADGRNTLFVMTTNLGAKEAMGLAEQRQPYRAKLQNAIENHFSAEFLGRLDRIIYFEPLSEAAMLQIFDKLFAQTAARFSEQGITVAVSEQVKEMICSQYTDAKRGARDLQRAIDDAIVAPITDRRLAGKIKPGMSVSLEEDDGALHIIYRGQEDPHPLTSRAESVERPQQEQPTDFDPMMDPVERRNRDLLAPVIRRLQEELEQEGFGLVVDEPVMELLCSPYMAEDWVKKDVPAAFTVLVAEPIREQVEQGKYQSGDVIRAFRDLGKIAFDTLSEEGR